MMEGEQTEGFIPNQAQNQQQSKMEPRVKRLKCLTIQSADERSLLYHRRNLPEKFF